MSDPDDRDHSIAPNPIAEEARRLPASRATPPPDPPPSRRRIGWLIVGITAGAVLVIAAREAIDASTFDPNDAGWGDIAFFVSPFFAIGSAMILGLALIIVAAIRLVGLRVGRAVTATVVGVVLGPAAYVVGMIAIAVVDGDAVPSAPGWAFMTIMFPVLCGLGATSFAALARWPIKAARRE